MTDNDANDGYPTPPRNGEIPSPSLSQTPTKKPRPRSYTTTSPRSSPDSQGLPTRPRPRSDYVPKRDYGVRFADPAEAPESPAGSVDRYTPSSSPERASAAQSEDDSAYSEVSDGDTSLVSVPAKRRRRAPRSGVRYLVAQPPPQAMKKHLRLRHLRSALLLQLQQLTDKRPKPVLDVLPCSILRKGAPRLAGRFPNPFGAKHELTSDSLVLAKSEDYDSAGPDGGSDELGSREIVAIISPRPGADSRADIVLADGTIWTAAALSSGSYEFTTVGADGAVVTARWAKRKVPLEDDDNYKYTFSVIDPTSRRHPIMGTLTASTLEVLDNYTTVSPHASRRHPPTRMIQSDAADAAGRTTLPVDERLRAFITVSGVAIALVKLGISTAPKPPSAPAAKAPAPQAVSANGSAGQRRRVSMPPGNPSRGNSTAPAEMDGPGSPAENGQAGDVRRRWTVSGKRRMETRSPSGKRRSDIRLPTPPETAEVLGVNGRVIPKARDEKKEKAREKEGKKRLYSRIKRVFGIRSNDDR